MIPEVKAALEAQYKLDLPLFDQYTAYLSDLAQGDLGPSFKYPGRSVNELIAAGFPVTAELALYALLVAVGIGVTAGVIAAQRPNTAQDYIPMSAAMIGICIPSLLLGPLLILVFGIHLDWLPVSGWGDMPGDKVLPSITLGSVYAAYIARLSRAGMLEVMTQDYIRTRPRQGPARVARGDGACAAGWPDTGGGVPRPGVRGPAVGFLRGRDHFPSTRPRPLLRAGGLQPRSTP